MGDASRNERAPSFSISTIDVESIEITKSDVVFSLKVNCGEKVYSLVKSYTDFFTLKNSLESDFTKRSDINFPTLRALKWFLQTRIWFNDALLDKKRRTIQDFCKGLLQLPKDVQSSAPMQKFFEQHNNSISDPANGSAAKVTGVQPIQPRTPPESNLHQKMYVVVAPFTENGQGHVSLQPGYIVELLKCEGERCFVHVMDTHEQGWASQSVLKPLSNDTSTSAHNNGASADPKPVRYYALLSSDGRNADEISYNSGEILEVLETLPDGMVRIRHGDKTGVTPASNLQPLAVEELDQEVSVDPYFVTLNKTRTNPNPANRISQELLQNVLPEQQVHYVVPTTTRVSTNGHSGGSGAAGQPETRPPATVSTPLPSGVTSLASSSATAADANTPANGKTPEPVYQQVILKKKPTVTVQPELHYAELDICKQGGPVRKPVVTDDVIYSEILPMVPPKHLLLEPVPEKESYINVRLRNKDSYENSVCVDSYLKKVREKSYRVSRDYVSKDVNKAARPTLNVSSGEVVQVELVEGGNCFCVVVGGNEQDGREGWLPRDILEEIAAVSNDDIDVEIPVDQRTLKKISTTQKPVVAAASSMNQAANPSSKLGTETNAKDKAPVTKTPIQPARSVPHPVGGGTQEVWAQSLTSFSDTAPQVLSFEAGCWAQVLNQDMSGWWLVRLGEQKGWVPGNFWTIVDKSSPVPESGDDVPPPVPGERRVRTSTSDQPPFVQCPWYYVGMSRNEAEQLLRTAGHKGTFLIRAGTSHNVDLCVSLMGDGRIHHFAIKYLPDGQLTIAQKNFRNMEKLIKFFSTNPICYSDNKEPCCFGNPLVTKQK